MNSEDKTKLFFDINDGPWVIEKLNLSIIMMTDAAIGSLIKQGYNRERDDIIIDLNDQSCLVKLYLRKKPVYEIKFNVGLEATTVDGEWIRKVGRRNWFSRILNLFYSKK